MRAPVSQAARKQSRGKRHEKVGGFFNMFDTHVFCLGIEHVEESAEFFATLSEIVFTTSFQRSFHGSFHRSSHARFSRKFSPKFSLKFSRKVFTKVLTEVFTKGFYKSFRRSFHWLSSRRWAACGPCWRRARGLCASRRCFVKPQPR